MYPHQQNGLQTWTWPQATIQLLREKSENLRPSLCVIIYCLFYVIFLQEDLIFFLFLHERVVLILHSCL